MMSEKFEKFRPTKVEFALNFFFAIAVFSSLTLFLFVINIFAYGADWRRELVIWLAFSIFSIPFLLALIIKDIKEFKPSSFKFSQKRSRFYRVSADEVEKKIDDIIKVIGGTEIVKDLGGDLTLTTMKSPRFTAKSPEGYLSRRIFLIELSYIRSEEVLVVCIRPFDGLGRFDFAGYSMGLFEMIHQNLQDCEEFYPFGE